MKTILATIFILLTLTSCKEINKEHTSVEKEIVDSNKEVEQQLNAFCFYKLDDKYATEKDGLIIANWLKEKSLAILENDSLDNIFTHNGGGPRGAEWNPGTDLFIAVLTPDTESADDLKLYVNDQLNENQIYTHSPNLIWYKIKYDLWLQNVKEIDSSAIEKIYSSETLDYYRSREKDSADAIRTFEYLSVGEVVKFDISHKANRITKFFHFAHGE